MYYDPLGRVVKTVNPDKSEQWVMYGIPQTLNAPLDPTSPSTPLRVTTQTPWENYTYDSNDLAPLTNASGSNVNPSHYYTPKSSETDVLGRTVRTTEFFNSGNYNDTISMHYSYDVRGNLLLVKDPYQRTVFTHVYDLRPPQKGDDGKDQPLPPLRTVHIDKGSSTILFDATGKPIVSDDAKGAQALSSYDVISRPVKSWARNKTGDAVTLRGFSVYGDATGIVSNTFGKTIESYDEAGKVSLTLYDFKGNVITKHRSVIADSELQGALNTYTNYIMDWDTAPTLSAPFISDMAYDALNRITSLKLPEDVAGNRKFITPTYNKAGALEKVSYDGTVYVENISYNAKGQRILIAFGNGVMTRYAYDNLTFRLLRQKSEKYNRTVAGDTVTYNYVSGTRQDDKFDYDLIGNIVKLFDRLPDCGVGGTPNALNRTFTYDPIYRLLSATGRESNTQNTNSYLYNDAPAPGSPNASNTRDYTRTYTYDKLGNVQEVVQPGTTGFTRAFTYTANQNTLEKIKDGTTLLEDYTYDACGNQLQSNLNRKYEWNYGDQLICYKNQVGSGTPTIYAQYDYAGQDRVSKIVRTGSAYERTIYIDGIFEYVSLGTLSVIDYEKNYIHIMDDKSRIAEVRIGDVFPTDITDSVTYVIEDQIGSSAMRVTTNGTEIDREEYYPFGDSSLRTFTYKRYRYVGKQKDGESGLYYYGARYYAAWTCRFISVDPLAGDYPQITSYNYANQNPIDDFDIDGQQDNNTEGKPNNNLTPGKVEGDKNKGASIESKVNGTGNLIIIYKDERNLTPEKYKISTPENENWDYVVVTKDNFKDLGKWVSDYTSKYGKINNLAIRSHGGGRLTRNNAIEIGGGVLKLDDFNNYVTDKTKGNQKDMAILDVISNIAKELSNNATIIIGACGIGQDDALMAGMAYVLNAHNTNREVLFNKSLTNRLNYMKLDLPMTDKKDFAGWGGWTKVNKNSFVMERNPTNKTKQLNFKQSFDIKKGDKEGNLILNSKGKPFTFEYQNK